MLASVAASLVTMSLRATLTRVGGLALAAFLDGLTSSLFSVAALPLMAVVTSSQNRSLLFSLNGLIGSLIGIPGNLLAGSLPQFYREAAQMSLLQAERLTLYTMILSVLASLALFARMRSTGAAHPLEHPSGAGPDRADAPPQMRTVLLQIGIVAGLLGLADGMFFPFGNIFFKQRYGFDTAQVGYVYATNQALVVILFLMLPLLTARWKKSHILATIRFIALPLIAALAFGPPAWLAWPCFVLGLAAFKTTMVTGDNIIVDIVPAAFRARAAGARYLGVSLGAIVSNAAGGWLIQNLGYPWPIEGSVVLGVGLAIALIVFFGRREPVPGASAPTVPQETA